MPEGGYAERFAIEGQHFGERMQSQEALNAFKGYLARKAG